MQEDNPENWLARSLRKQQEEHPLPYDTGAWEAFEKKRKISPFHTRTFWISGIAASVALLIGLGLLWLTPDRPNPAALQPLADQFTPSSAPEDSQAELPGPIHSVDSAAAAQTQAPSPNASLTAPLNSRVPGKKNRLAPTPRANSKSRRTETPKSQFPAAAPSEANLAEAVTPAVIPASPVGGSETSQAVQVAQAQQPLQPSSLLSPDPILSEEEIKEILSSDPLPLHLSLGLQPGFGTSQTSAQTTSGNSLGLGLSVDLPLTSKLSVGSGLAVNYLNQASERQSYAQLAGFTSPVVQTNEISQVQVDLPIYIRYPLTDSRSISVQAGFSNLLTFNQSAAQESTYTREVAVLDADMASANSFTLKTESVSLNSDLSVPGNRFFPFATANLGVNFRLYQSKKTSYEVMPFYNYPLQELSGYGEKLGLFGASFKVNFQTQRRK